MAEFFMRKMSLHAEYMYQIQNNINFAIVDPVQAEGEHAGACTASLEVKVKDKATACEGPESPPTQEETAERQE